MSGYLKFIAIFHANSRIDRPSGWKKRTRFPAHHPISNAETSKGYRDRGRAHILIRDDGWSDRYFRTIVSNHGAVTTGPMTMHEFHGWVGCGSGCFEMPWQLQGSLAN
jgi:hypothetical protein